MAYWIQETGTHHNFSNYKSFRCDYRSDIEKLPRVGIPGVPQEGDTVSSLPCAYGSDCLCLEDSSNWVLSKDTNEWKCLTAFQSGSTEIMTNDYNNLINKPSINGIKLSGNLTLDDIGITDVSSNDDFDFSDFF